MAPYQPMETERVGESFLWFSWQWVTSQNAYILIIEYTMREMQDVLLEPHSQED